MFNFFLHSAPLFQSHGIGHADMPCHRTCPMHDKIKAGHQEQLPDEDLQCTRTFPVRPPQEMTARVKRLHPLHDTDISVFERHIPCCVVQNHCRFHHRRNRKSRKLFTGWIPTAAPEKHMQQRRDIQFMDTFLCRPGHRRSAFPQVKRCNRFTGGSRCIHIRCIHQCAQGQSIA